MYHTILVPLDGSAFGERALPMAETLARATGANVVLMRAASASTLLGADAAEAQCQAVEEAQAYLSALATGLSDRGLHVEVAAPYGDAADAILMEASLRGADLVVMCTHGRSGLGRWIYGSVAEKVLTHSPAPVLLVHPTGEVTTLGPEAAKTPILIPLDGSAFAEAALPHAATLARMFGGSILLVRAVGLPIAAYSYPEMGLVQESLEEEQHEAETYLAEVAQRLRGDGLTVQTVVREGWPADIITYRGAERGSRLVVMATHGRTGIVRLLLGSVALAVIRRCPLPVLLIRPAELAETAQI
jgi:nucleotide-binding universal stress UspA family protein